MKLRGRLLSLYARVFARPQFQPLHRILFKLALRGMGIMNFYDLQVSGERNFIKTCIADLSSPVVFDVGAHDGEYAAEILRENPSARLYAFEPHPGTFQRLAKRGLVAINTACGDSEGNLTLYDYDSLGSAHASLYRGVFTGIHGAEPRPISVPILRLDDFAKENRIEQIDFLKIDTEGNELNVLRGAQGLISQRKVKIIQLEFNAHNVYSRTFFRDIYDLLSEYDLFRLLPNHLMPICEYSIRWCEIFEFQNIVAFLRNVRVSPP